MYITTVVTGHDGLIKSVNICTSNSRTNHPISRLYPLEISCRTGFSQDTTDRQGEVTDIDSSHCTRSQEGRPTRAAALKARAKLADWTNSLRGPREDVKD